MNYPPLYQLAKNTAQMFKGQTVAAASTVVGPSATTGTAIPVDANGEMIVVYNVLNGASATCTVDIKITESATTNGTYTDVPNTAITQIPTGNALESFGAIRVPVEGRLGFIRMSVTTGAGTNGPIVTGTLCWGGKHAVP